MLCAKLIQQSDGSYLFGPDLTATDMSTCSYVVLSGQDSLNGLWSLTPESALQISGAIGLLWGFAWVIRQVAQYFRSKENVEED